jgi:polyhydroxyalkanoate synthesis regulator phasin
MSSSQTKGTSTKRPRSATRDETLQQTKKKTSVVKPKLNSDNASVTKVFADIDALKEQVRDLQELLVSKDLSPLADIDALREQLKDLQELVASRGPSHDKLLCIGLGIWTSGTNKVIKTSLNLPSKLSSTKSVSIPNTASTKPPLWPKDSSPTGLTRIYTHLTTPRREPLDHAGILQAMMIRQSREVYPRLSSSPLLSDAIKVERMGWDWF